MNHISPFETCASRNGFCNWKRIPLWLLYGYFYSCLSGITPSVRNTALLHYFSCFLPKCIKVLVIGEAVFIIRATNCHLCTDQMCCKWASPLLFGCNLTEIYDQLGKDIHALKFVKLFWYSVYWSKTLWHVAFWGVGSNPTTFMYRPPPPPERELAQLSELIISTVSSDWSTQWAIMAPEFQLSRTITEEQSSKVNSADVDWKIVILGALEKCKKWCVKAAQSLWQLLKCMSINLMLNVYTVLWSSEEDVALGPRSSFYQLIYSYMYKIQKWISNLRLQKSPVYIFKLLKYERMRLYVCAVLIRIHLIS